MQADPKYGLVLTAEFFSNGYRVGSANLQKCLCKLVVFRVNLLRTYKVYSSTPSTFDSFDNETGVQSTEWIYVKRH
jgi:hypothetical protein